MATRKPPRQMAAKACERCRRRKIKCDEFFPCGQCTRMRVACKIEDPAEKRREQQQTAMEDRIKRLEALLIETYTNPNNQINMDIPGLVQEGLLPNPPLGVSSGQPSSRGVKTEPPRLTLQTPASPEFHQTEGHELLSAGEHSSTYPYWSPPSSLAPSAPASASDYFSPNDLPPWSTTVNQGGSMEPSVPAQHGLRHGGRTRTSSMSTSEASQEDLLNSTIPHDRNRFSIDISGSTLDIPQIEVTSWDHSRPQSPAGISPNLSPAMSRASLMDMDGSFYPPELSIGSWSGLSSPSIMAPSFTFDQDNMLLANNQSLPSHSRRSSVNSLAADYDAYNEPKRRRAASDVLPFPQQYMYPDGDTNDQFYSCDTSPRSTTPTIQQQPLPQNPNLLQDQSPQSQAKDDLYNRTFVDIVHPLFPILSPQNMPGNISQPFNQQSPSSTSISYISNQRVSQDIAQTQFFFTRAIATYVLARRSSQATLPAQNYFNHGLKAHGPGRWDSLPGIQTGILLAVFILISGCQGPNLYLLNSNIVAACFDLGLHRGGLTAGSLEANTVFAAYVLDRTVARVRQRPILLKDEDLESGALALINAQLRERVEKGLVRRWPEGGRLWDWWASYEDNVRAGGLGLELDLSASGLGQEHQMDQGYGFGNI